MVFSLDLWLARDGRRNLRIGSHKQVSCACGYSQAKHCIGRCVQNLSSLQHLVPVSLRIVSSAACDENQLQASTVVNINRAFRTKRIPNLQATLIPISTRLFGHRLFARCSTSPITRQQRSDTYQQWLRWARTFSMSSTSSRILCSIPSAMIPWICPRSYVFPLGNHQLHLQLMRIPGCCWIPILRKVLRPRKHSRQRLLAPRKWHRHSTPPDPPAHQCTQRKRRQARRRRDSHSTYSG